nr:VTT domain-containing protein [Legionella tunisiensis]
MIEAHQFYEKHGGKTIILARFIPIIRTFVPFVAGVGYMSVSSFSIYNLISALLWVGGLLSLGYFLVLFRLLRTIFPLSFMALLLSLFYHRFLLFFIVR